MIIISHRGNLRGPDKNTENTPDQILSAGKAGFDVEVDLWVIDNELFLGHDEPLHKIEYSFLEDIGFRLWIHCKNLEAIKFLQALNSPLNYFWHQNDDFTITSHGQIWTYPGKELFENSVDVNLEEFPKINLKALAICTDYPERVKDECYRN